jgi:hypothetical protein
MHKIIFMWLMLAPAIVLAQTAPPLPASPAPDAASSRWPMVADSPVGQITIYKPQLEDFQGEQITGRAAVSVIRPGQTDPIFGAIWITSRVSTDRVAQTVQVLDVQITKARFPDLQPADQQALTDAIRQRMLQDPPVLSLSHLLASLEVVKKQQAAGDTLQTAPPKIVYVEHPAVKVQYDGKPRFMQQGNDPTILVAANTPFLVALNLGDKQYYLYGAGQWFTAPDALGPFAVANAVPNAVNNLAAAANAPNQNAPANPDEAAAEKLTPQQLAAVQIVTATEPTELIWTDGPAQMSSVQGTDLLYVANTPADLFLNIDDQHLYVLLSGRWFSAPNHNGPWTFVPPDQLPADFAKIPPDSDRGTVLAQVPGTPQAEDAVMDTYIPQTAVIDRAQVDRPAVEYDGDPQFQQIDQTAMAYAVNTAYSVVWANNQYYCCWNGVWYVSPAAVGPWGVCISVPGVIYTMPPSCPLYPCRYVIVYGYTPQFVYCGYTPGYVGCYVYHGVVVYGTGYVYRPWDGNSRFYARPYTFGFGAQYDPYTHFWGFGFGLGRGAQWVRPQPRVVLASGGYFGYGGYRAVGDRPDRVTINHTVINQNITVVHNETIVEHNVYARRTDVRASAGPHQQPGRIAAPSHGEPGQADVMSDSQGNVYRRTVDGWERRQGTQWVGSNDAHAPASDRPAPQPKNRPAPTPAPSDQPHDDSGQADHSATGGGSGGGKAKHDAGDSADMRQLNQDYHARVSGEQRDAAREKQEQRDNSARDSGDSRQSDHSDSGNGSGRGGKTSQSGNGNNNGSGNQNGNGGNAGGQGSGGKNH